MKLRNPIWKKQAISAMLGMTLACGLSLSAGAAGTWTAVTTAAPEAIDHFVLLTDGRVMIQGNENNTWYALTPDATGSYVNGTFSSLASMATKRHFYASAVLRNGDLFVSGGEYSNANGINGENNDTNRSEIYHLLTNTWTPTPVPKHRDGSFWTNIGAAPAKTLPDGRILLGDLLSTETTLYDYTTNTWTPSANLKLNARCDEEDWVLMPDGSVLTIDADIEPADGSNPAERYIPGSDSWVQAGNTGAHHPIVEKGSLELGPGILLPYGAKGTVLYTGATGHTALYTPDPLNALGAGTWVAGPNLIGSKKTQLLAQKDGPGCVEVNGKVLLLTAPDSKGVVDSFPSGQHFLEYTFDTTANHGVMVEVSKPPVGSDPDNPLYDPNQPAYVGRMLALPNGQVLFANSGDSHLFVYTPDSGANAAWKPTITNITANGDGSFLLTGTQFNGLTEGALYGDDVQNSSNYPLVRLTDGSGNVSYGRTFNHSTMGVQTGTTLVSTNFVPPVTLPSGIYTLQVVANGIASDGITFIK